jgi:hypothetical protein
MNGKRQPCAGGLVRRDPVARFPRLRSMQALCEPDEARLLRLLIYAARQGTRVEATHLDPASVAEFERRMVTAAKRLAPDASRAPAADGLARERLLVRLIELANNPTSETSAEVERLFGFAPRALAPTTRVPRDPLLLEAWQTVLSFCARLHPARAHKLGRLPFVGDAARAALATESRELREAAPGARYVRPGPMGSVLAVHPRLMTHLTHIFGQSVTPSKVANYIYYTRPGDYLVPHRDIGDFEINVLLMVDRRQPVGGGRPSALLVYRSDGEVERIHLEPGEAVAMEARWIVHAREPLADGESLALLTIGCMLE